MTFHAKQYRLSSARSLPACAIRGTNGAQCSVSREAVGTTLPKSEEIPGGRATRPCVQEPQRIDVPGIPS